MGQRGKFLRISSLAGYLCPLLFVFNLSSSLPLPLYSLLHTHPLLFSSLYTLCSRLGNLVHIVQRPIDLLKAIRRVYSFRIPNLLSTTPPKISKRQFQKHPIKSHAANITALLVAHPFSPAAQEHIYTTWLDNSSFKYLFLRSLILSYHQSSPHIEERTDTGHQRISLFYPTYH